MLAAVAGGLRQLLAGRGEPVDRLMLRAMVPISLHHEQPGQTRGNQPGWMMVPLPLGKPDPVHRRRCTWPGRGYWSCSQWCRSWAT